MVHLASTLTIGRRPFRLPRREAQEKVLRAARKRSIEEPHPAHSSVVGTLLTPRARNRAVSTGAACQPLRKADVLVLKPPFGSPAVSSETRRLCAPASRRDCLFVNGHVLVGWALGAQERAHPQAILSDGYSRCNSRSRFPYGRDRDTACKATMSTKVGFGRRTQNETRSGRS
jgi:hypothetical protein